MGGGLGQQKLIAWCQLIFWAIAQSRRATKNEFERFELMERYSHEESWLGTTIWNCLNWPNVRYQAAWEVLKYGLELLVALKCRLECYIAINGRNTSKTKHAQGE